MLQIPTDKSLLKSKRFLVVLSVFLILIILIFFVFNHSSIKQKPSYRTSEVATGEIKLNVPTYGKLKAKIRSAIMVLSSGHVNNILLRPGAKVRKGTPIIMLTNPKIVKSYQNSQLLLLEEQAKVTKLKAELIQNYSQQQANIKLAQAELSLANINLQANKKLRKNNVVSELQLQKTTMEYAKNKISLEIEENKLMTMGKTQEASLKSAFYRLKIIRAKIRTLKEDINNLSLVSPMTGILMSLDDKLEIGQKVTEGQYLGSIVDNKSLYAELTVSASYADKLAFNQVVELNIRSENILGYITRIAPKVINGSIQIDVAFKKELSDSYLPNIEVTGAVTLKDKKNILITLRPQNINKPNTKYMLFVRQKKDDFYQLKQLTIGMVSENKMQILNGAQQGDIILYSVPKYLIHNNKITLVALNG